MEAINNPWIIGIGGGLLSGLLVTLITRYLFSKRDNREYTQKVVTANQEILYAIRPGISEGVIPSQDVLDSMISATALKYSVDANDLHSSSAFADVLIKEVMDSSFLSASAKAEFCHRLSDLRPAPPSTQSLQSLAIEGIHAVPRLSDYRRKMITRMSAMMGVMAALMTLVFAFSEFFDGAKSEIRSKDLFLLVPTAATILIAMVATYSLVMLRFIERRRSKRRTSSSASSEDLGDDEDVRNN